MPSEPGNRTDDCGVILDRVEEHWAEGTDHDTR